MSNRMQRVNELVKREISTIIERNFEFPDILVTVHAAEVEQNLKTAKVHVGVIGEQRLREAAIKKLNAKHGLIQTQLAKRIVLRNTPVLTFVIDDSIERGNRVVDLLEGIGEIPDYDDDYGEDSEAADKL